MREMTIKGLIEHLQCYPEDALCCGTFWLADDFLMLDDSLTEEQIEEAMAIASRNHDAEQGFNWFTLQLAIDQVKR
ncbi:hypothetical protein R9X49_21930 [Pectobacterium carotovorum]|uniref:hypothetical protein n=1 Tax=Pectobacterium carotovorum TaxID=554 RepID=UPI0029DB41DA|nr:hypothetical protein [Pectobacterium carotovorum]MDX6917758.1 hypothetical protein [Pectobacterium carotovorum]